jgi:uncharacterized membrane protein YdjX (TVP38/TMEM64 family)
MLRSCREALSGTTSSTMRDQEHTQAAVGGSYLRRHSGLIATGVALALTALLFVLIPELRRAFSLTARGDLSGLRHYIRGLGAGGAALLFGLMLLHAIVFYPTEILTTTSGFVYGFLPGLGLAITGWVCSSVISYWLGRTIGRPVLLAVLGKRFVRLEQAMETGGVQLMLSARLVPIVPFSLLGYVVGATRRSLWTLVWTSAVGYLPLTAAVAYLGAHAQSLSASNPLVWVAVVVVIALLVLSRLMARRSLRHDDDAPTAEQPDPETP